MSKFHDLTKRSVVSICWIVIIGLLVGFCMEPIVQAIITVVFAIVAAVGTWEYIQFLRKKDVDVFSTPLILFAALELIAFYFALTFKWGSQLPLAVLFLAGFVFFFCHFKKISGSIVSVASQVFGLCYIAVPLGLMLKILYPVLLHEFSIQDGRLWFVYLIVVTKVTDVGAYFGGRFLGKRPFAPNLSPKKTWEGAACGVLIAIIVSVIFAACGLVFRIHSIELSYLWSVVMGVLIGVFGQLGDLAESLLKRDAEIKDSNRIPGMGGILDTLDSLLFTAPVVYFYLHTV
jgi:phosphatidate cytidylyltransferase